MSTTPQTPTPTGSPASTAPNTRQFLGHPAMLFSLFNVELWERFSFYGMQAIAAYYIYYSTTDGGLGLDETMAIGIIGAYGGVVYLSTVLGAWIADRLFGPERVLFYSGILIMFGHIALALIPGVAGLIAGLAMVGIGSGGLKATATSLVGTLYAKDDERKDAGFSIFYMGVNIGALFGPLVTGWLQVAPGLGFHIAFGAAAVGMAIGLVTYAITRKNMPESSHVVANPLPKNMYWVLPVGVIALAAVIAILLASGIVNANNLATSVGIAVAVIAAIYFFVILSSKQITSDERSRVFSFIPLFIASTAFWALFQQQFTVIPVYAESRLDRNIFGFVIPPAWVNSINPIFIIIFAGIFAAIWTALGKRQPTTPTKFAIALVIMGLAFFLFVPFAGSGENSVPFIMIIGVLFLFTLAELNISPIGLSLATKLAPEKFQTQMVALFFLSVSLGSTLAGVLGQLGQTIPEGTYFLMVGIASIVVAGLLLLVSPWIRKAMKGVH